MCIVWIERYVPLSVTTVMRMMKNYDRMVMIIMILIERKIGSIVGPLRQAQSYNITSALTRDFLDMIIYQDICHIDIYHV